MLHELIEHHQKRAQAEIEAPYRATIQHPRDLAAIHRRLIENTAPLYAEIARLERLKTTVEITLLSSVPSSDVAV